MANEWRETSLGDVIELKRGYDLPQQNRKPGNTPIVSSSGVTGFHDSAMVKAPGVVTGRYGTLGQVFLLTQDFWPLNTTLYVRDFKGNDPRFISYFLRTLDFSAYSDKAAVPGLNRNHLHTARVRVPSSIDEQRAIAHILGSLDDKIELNRRMNATLEEMARALFQAWFVDFAPVRAKLAGRATGLPDELADLFPAALVASEVGEIPAGWEVVALPDAIEVNPSRSLAGIKSAPYLDMASMPTRGHRPDQWIERSVGSGMKFINSDTLVARITPCLENGKTAFVDFLEDGQVGWGSTEYIVLRPKEPLPPPFAYYLARSEGFRTFAIQNMTGSSGRQRVPAECLKLFPVVMPSAQVAQQFGELARGFMERVRVNSEQDKTLAALRDVLLPKLILGELRVGEAEDLLLQPPEKARMIRGS